MTDEQYMRRALDLAEQGRYTVNPNPMVGCVLVRDGAIIGEGWHHRAGEPHAEIGALHASGDARGATAYVTLEPCSHFGRTGPCADALIEAGIARAVVATADPHDLVDGRGLQKLRDAAIKVEVGRLEQDARRQNEKFFWAASRRLPFVLLKAAMTLDGKLATITRDSQWITGDPAREASLMLREEYDAIIVGSGTVKADNPRLTRRLGRAGDATPWLRVVLDGNAEVPPHSQVLTDGGATLLYTSRPSLYEVNPSLEIIETEARIDIGQVLGDLHARGVHSVIVEGGSLVHADVIARSLWQKLVIFVAPMIVGGDSAPSIFAGEPVSRLTDAYRFRFDRAEFVGSDLMLTAYQTS